MVSVKISSELSKYDLGCSSRIRILILTFRIPDPGVKKALDPGSATLLNTIFNEELLLG
jgi:hypothetical protein